MKYEYGTYHLRTYEGRPIRKAAYVKDLATGEVVRFLDMIGKRRAYAQAFDIFKRRKESQCHLSGVARTLTP